MRKITDLVEDALNYPDYELERDFSRLRNRLAKSEENIDNRRGIRI